MINEIMPTSKEHAEYIKSQVPLYDIYNQLAEEAAELSQAANKMVRVLRGTNPSSVGADDAFNNLIEEYTDVINVAQNVLDIYPDDLIMDYKLYRWRKRLENNNK